MPTSLSLVDHVTAIAHGGRILRDAAAVAGLDAPVPTCPAWDVRELVTHQGMVHRWAAANLRGEADHRTGDSTAAAAAADDLLGWFDAGVEQLIGAFRAAPEDVTAMVFLNDAPAPKRFWARRQAHETTIHGTDAVAARLGRWPDAGEAPVPADLAVDGIDELLCGFVTRGKGKLRPDGTITIGVTTTDTDHSWTVRADGNSLATTPGPVGEVDAVLTGTAAQLYLGLWNRGDEIAATGRADALALWRDQVQVQWR